MSNESFRERGGNKQKKRDTALIENLLEEDYALIIGSETILEKDAIKTQNTGDSMFRVYNAIHTIPPMNPLQVCRGYVVLYSENTSESTQKNNPKNNNPYGK